MKLLAAALVLRLLAPPEHVAPVLDFPEAGLDDPAAYQGYRTRFYRDVRGNTLQVYLDQRDGRVVSVWADAADESLGFTLRTPSGAPAPLGWAADSAVVDSAGGVRTLEYRLRVDAPAIDVGRFLLGSMRLERDFQYTGGHRLPFGAPSIEQPELDTLLACLQRLDAAERARHLAALRAPDVAALRARLRPAVSVVALATAWRVRVEQPSFDGRNHLALEIEVDRAAADVAARGGAVTVRARGSGPILLAVRVATDAEPLTPLRAGEIFDAGFLRYLAARRAERDSLRALPPGRRDDAAERRLLRLRRMERQVASLELLSSREKLMAGLPNYGTYFGRDMLVSALMMEPVWTDRMSEYVIGAALRKLSPGGEVSHEEALGGQAIRENAAVYNTVMGEYFAHLDRGERSAADSSLAQARRVLGDLQRVRENYRMMDDDFQLPVIVGHYLTDPRVTDERKRAFLLSPVPAQDGATVLGLVLRNLAYVSRMAQPYVESPVATRLVGFPPRTDSAWFPGSWRDSNAGYANGRYAMDVNVVWVPAALDAIGRVLPELRRLVLGADRPELAAPAVRLSPLAGYLRDPASLRRAQDAWRGTARHFAVTLAPAEVGRRVRARLAAMPQDERAYWTGVLERDPPAGELTFLALSLDARGRPVPVVNTDVGMRLFVGARSALGLTPAEVERDLRPVVTPYPVGLLVPQLGPLVANDAYASPRVWEAFERDRYHSPHVVWGREVNLLLLGVAGQLEAATDATGAPRRPELAGYVASLARALRDVRAASEASGLGDQELWSYRIEGGKLRPVRYATSTDLQLWNLTELAVQYELARLAPPAAGPGTRRAALLLAGQ